MVDAERTIDSCMVMRVQLIHNPASGNHHELRLDLLAQAFEACGATVVPGQTSIDEQTAIAADCDLLCVAGGDGTLRLVLSAIIAQRRQVPICVYPAGTVNLVARELGYARDPDLFASEVMAGFLAGKNSRLLAPVAATDHGPFVSCLSAGPDALAVARLDGELKKRWGTGAYVWSFLKLLQDWPRLTYRLQLKTGQGKISEIDCAAFYLLKGHHYAGRWSLAPHANLASQAMELVALTTSSRLGFLRFCIAVAFGRDPSSLANVEAHRVNSVAISIVNMANDEHAFQQDGDPISRAPAHITMTDQFITYCLPVGD